MLTGISEAKPVFIDADGCSFEGPYGAISEVYYQYGMDRGHSHVLGCPVSNEKDFDTGVEDQNLRDDRYQEFEHGSIYYNSRDKTAFALFNQIDIVYKQHKKTLLMPIASEIGDANTSPYKCRAYFENGYLKCDEDDQWVVENPGFWGTGVNSPLYVMDENGDLPDILMPFERGVGGRLNSGPHEYANGNFGSRYTAGFGSGLDIGAPIDTDMNVLASAPGTIIDIFPDPAKNQTVDCTTRPPSSGFGCWVTIRHEFSGTTMTYGHIQPSRNTQNGVLITVGTYIATGNIIGRTTTDFVGYSGGPHVHLEYRTGTNYEGCNFLTLQSTCNGRPIDWNGIVIDHTLISGATDPDAGLRFNYDGTGIISNDFTENRYTDYELQSDFDNLLTDPTWSFRDYLYDDSSGNPVYSEHKDIRTWMTVGAWNTCQNEHNDRCEDGSNFYDNTIFSWGGLTSTNEPTNNQPGSIIQNEPILFSNNDETPYQDLYEVPYPNPQPTPTPGGALTNCPSDNRDGVYFYENPYYTGDCTYSAENIPDFGLTQVGNDRLSSVIIRGDYKVKLYEDRNYNGLSDELNDSDSNLDIRSLGDQYSSAKVSENITQCPDDGREGAYMYSDINYLGDCIFSTVNIPFFGDTALGDNDLSSIRFIGHWDAKLYKDANFNGIYEFVGSDEPDLNSRSLGQQFSSAKLIRNDYGPTPTPSPNTVVLLSGAVNNGGFESQNMSGWTSQGGTFVIDQVNPHSGWYYVKGTTAEEAKFYRYFDLTPWQTQINEGKVSSTWRVYVDPGDHENFKFNVKFLDANSTALYSYGTGWVWHEGGYDDRGRTLDVVPANTTKVYLEMNMRRVMTDFTDCDVDDFYLDIRIDPGPAPTATPEPTSTPMPDCYSGQGDQPILYDHSYCNSFAGSLPFGITNSFFNLELITWSDRISSLYLPEGKSLLIYDEEDGNGEAVCVTDSVNDLNEFTFENGESLSNRATSIYLYSEENCSGVIATNGTSILDPLAGEVVSVGYDLKNISGRELIFEGILAGIHGPYCQEWNCPNINDFPWAQKVTIGPGETYQYRTERMFNTVDSNYLYEYLSLDGNGLWRAYFPTRQFGVGRGIEVIRSVTLTPEDPVVGEEVRAEFTIKNFGTRLITLPNVMVIAKGPNCSSWDCPDGWADFPWVHDIALEPGEEYTYSQTRPFYRLGSSYFADAAFGDHNVWWYEIPKNVRLNFHVEGSEIFLPVIIR